MSVPHDHLGAEPYACLENNPDHPAQGGLRDAFVTPERATRRVIQAIRQFEWMEAIGRHPHIPQSPEPVGEWVDPLHDLRLGGYRPACGQYHPVHLGILRAAVSVNAISPGDVRRFLTEPFERADRPCAAFVDFKTGTGTNHDIRFGGPRPRAAVGAGGYPGYRDIGPELEGDVIDQGLR